MQATPLNTPWGHMGRGVTDTGVSRVRDWLLDSSVRSESGMLGHAQTLGSFLGQVEAAINEPSEYGIGASLDGLFNAFSELANDPSSRVHRGLVQQHAQRLVDQLHLLDSNIVDTGRTALAEMHANVDEVNRIASEVAHLNELILASGPSHDAPDLEDRRDLLVDQLSESLDVRVLRHDDGTVGVVGGGALLVDGGTARELEVRTLAAGQTGVGVVGGNDVDPSSGIAWQAGPTGGGTGNRSKCSSPQWFYRQRRNQHRLFRPDWSDGAHAQAVGRCRSLYRRDRRRHYYCRR